MVRTIGLTYIGLVGPGAGISILFFIFWIVGLALPAKEILGKPS